MDTYSHIWSFRTARFRVALEAALKFDVDISWDETGETAAKIESGEWECFSFRIAVYLDGELISADYLSNSVYADPLNFYREHIGIRAAGYRYGCYFSDMVKTAIQGAREHVARMPKLRAI